MHIFWALVFLRRSNPVAFGLPCAPYFPNLALPVRPLSRAAFLEVHVFHGHGLPHQESGFLALPYLGVHGVRIAPPLQDAREQ